MSNTITITGNLGRDVETRTTKSGKEVSDFSLGHTPRYKTEAGWVDGETIWFKVAIWERLPAALFVKGTHVVVTGELNQESWGENDAKKTALVIKASSIGVVTKATRETPAQWPAKPTGSASWSQPAPTLDDAPF
jgi:single-strand DNA-binding protein